MNRFNVSGNTRKPSIIGALTIALRLGVVRSPRDGLQAVEWLHRMGLGSELKGGDVGNLVRCAEGLIGRR